MKKTVNDIYCLGVIENNGVKETYCFNNLTKNLSRWKLTKDGKETLEKSIPLGELPKSFENLFHLTGDIKIDLEPKRKKEGDWL